MAENFHQHETMKTTCEPIPEQDNVFIKEIE